MDFVDVISSPTTSIASNSALGQYDSTMKKPTVISPTLPIISSTGTAPLPLQTTTSSCQTTPVSSSLRPTNDPTIRRRTRSSIIDTRSPKTLIPGTVTVANDSSRKTFNDRLEELKQFKEKYGHCNVPQGYAADPSLGHWCSHMRSSYKNFRNGKGRKLGMSEERIQQLEQLGFQWVGKHGGYWAKSFEERMADLREFKKVNGHCNVPDGFNPDPSLGQWCRNMRRGYKALKTGRGPRYGMNDERIRELDQVNFEWVAKIGGFSAKTFKDRMQDLIEYKRIHGHCNVPSRYADDPSLGQWCSQLRRGYKAFINGKGPKRGMNKERIKELEKVGFEWVVRKK